MPVTVFHAAPTARGLGDGSSAANAGQLFPSGNLNSTIASHNFSTSCLQVMCQNTGTYTLSQSLAAAVFATPPTASTYALFMIGCDSSGNPTVPVDYGWRCEEGDLDVTGYAVLNFTLTASPVITGLNVRMSFIDASLTTSTTAFSQDFGKKTWCRFTVTSTSTSTVAILHATTSAGMSNCQVRMIGSGYNHIIRGSTSGGQLNNIRIIGDPTSTTGTRYGLAQTITTAYPIATGRIFVCDVTGIGVVNYNVGATAGLILSEATIVNCGIGVSLLGANNARMILSNVVITGCTTGVTHASGLYIFDNVLLRNTTDYGVTAEVPVGEPFAIVTTETDSQLYANHSVGDYRIKSTSVHWGKNRGAGDEVVTGGGSGNAQHRHGIYLGSKGVAV